MYIPVISPTKYENFLKYPHNFLAVPNSVEKSVQ